MLFMETRLLIDAGTAYLELAFPRETKTSRGFFSIFSLVCPAHSDKHGKNSKDLSLFFPW